MRDFARTITVVLAVLAAMALMVTPQAFAAKASFDEPDLGPPHGLATQGDAGGTKLYGVIIVKYFNITIQPPFRANFEVVARLRKSSSDETFYATGGTNTVNVEDPGAIQSNITPLLHNQILGYFFPNETGLCVTLKRVNELDRTPDSLWDDLNLIFDVADVELAVSSCKP